MIVISLNIVQAKNAPLDKILAVVNDEVITQSDLYQYSDQIKQQIQSQGRTYNLDKKLKSQLLQNIIEEKLQLQLAEKMKLQIKPEEIDKTINQIAQSNKLSITELKNQLKASKISFNLFKSNLKKQLLLQRLQQSQLQSAWKISNKDLNDTIKKIILRDKKENTQYQLQHLLLPLPEQATQTQENKLLEQAKKITLALKKDSNQFTTYAQNKSKLKLNLKNSDLGLRKLSEIPDMFKKITPSLQVGEIRSGFKDESGFHFIKLTKRIYNAPSQDKLKTFASQQLSAQRARIELKHWIVALKKNAFIKIITQP